MEQRFCEVRMKVIGDEASVVAFEDAFDRSNFDALQEWEIHTFLKEQLLNDQRTISIYGMCCENSVTDALLNPANCREKTLSDLAKDLHLNIEIWSSTSIFLGHPGGEVEEHLIYKDGELVTNDSVSRIVHEVNSVAADHMPGFEKLDPKRAEDQVKIVGWYNEQYHTNFAVNALYNDTGCFVAGGFPPEEYGEFSI